MHGAALCVNLYNVCVLRKNTPNFSLRTVLLHRSVKHCRFSLFFINNEKPKSCEIIERIDCSRIIAIFE